MRRSSPRDRFFASGAALGALVLLGSCNNSYDLLIHDRFEQGGFNSNVDILWVVDNSSSMTDEQAGLAANFSAFISAFANVGTDDGTTLEYGTITEATVAWAEYQQNQDRFLNYNMGVITSDVTLPGNGNQGNIRSLGGIGGDTCEPARILRPTDDNVAADFIDLVDVGIDGSGSETGILGAAFALCKGMDGDFWASLDSLPDDDPVKEICGRVEPSERATGDTPPCNADATGPFFRDDAATAVIIVSDEGDAAASRNDLPPESYMTRCIDDNAQNPDFGPCNCRTQWFLDFFDGVGRQVVFFTITPSYQLKGSPIAWCDGGELDIPGPCNEFGSGTCSLDFYQQAACESLGSYIPIAENVGGVTQEEPPDCRDLNFETALTDIGSKISNLDKGWRLSLTPDISTISVYVEDEEVPRQVDSPSGGWRYVPAENSIDFTGEAVPGFNEAVDIYYLPAFGRDSQTGRALPF